MSDRFFRERYLRLRKTMDHRVASMSRAWKAKDLGEGCNYVLHAKGKRVRSILLLLSCEAVGGNSRNALDAGAAVEAMHNFTLVHDDIMDNAGTRRGHPTVHKRWNTNTALLVGDVLLGQAYAQLLRTKTTNIKQITALFTEGLLEVCEGQALDLEFERESGVSLSDYFTMIEKKTARLISMSTEMGAIIGGGTKTQIRNLRSFGHYLGRAFQVQDDLLDVVADQKDFGKTIGGDILEGKKTFLLIHAYQRSVGKDRRLLGTVMRRQHDKRSKALVSEVRSLYEKHGVLESARKQIRKDTEAAMSTLARLPQNRATEMLLWFSGVLLNRRT